MHINITGDEAIVLAACVARVNNENYVDLLDKLVAPMTYNERDAMRKTLLRLEVSRHGRKCAI